MHRNHRRVKCGNNGKQKQHQVALPLHVEGLQDVDSVEGPTQARPPFWGAGLEHVRLLDLTPPPQVLEHVVHPPQAPQLPLTAVKKGKPYVSYTYIMLKALDSSIVEYGDISLGGVLVSLDSRNETDSILPIPSTYQSELAVEIL